MNGIVSHNLTTGDNMNAMESFFGPYRGSHEDMRADEQLAHETYNLHVPTKERTNSLKKCSTSKFEKKTNSILLGSCHGNSPTIYTSHGRFLASIARSLIWNLIKVSPDMSVLKVNRTLITSCAEV